MVQRTPIYAHPHMAAASWLQLPHQAAHLWTSWLMQPPMSSASLVRSFIFLLLNFQSSWSLLDTCPAFLPLAMSILDKRRWSLLAVMAASSTVPCSPITVCPSCRLTLSSGAYVVRTVMSSWRIDPLSLCNVLLHHWQLFLLQSRLCLKLVELLYRFLLAWYIFFSIHLVA